MGRLNIFRRGFLACFVAAVLGGHACAIDFVFLYDDPAGQGFLDPVQGPARQAALEEAGEIWGRLIPSTHEGETVEVRAKFGAFTGSTLASCAPNYFYSDFGSSNPAYQEDVNYPKALGNHLALRDLAPERHEMNMTVNQASNFYFGIGGSPSPSETDFISVAVHELGHGLGYDNSFQQDGDYGILGARTVTDPCPGCLPMPYDTFLTSGPSGPALTSLSQSQIQAALVSNLVFWNGANATAANGGTPVRINAPNPYDAGSSIAHLDPSENGIMVPTIGPGITTRMPTFIDRALLRDMGWTINVAPTQINWTGLGGDNNASTAANWSPALPQPDDSLVFDQSPQTDVQMNLPLGTLRGISFAATAPAYTLRFKSNVDIDFTGTGIINFSPTAKTIFLESPLQDEITPSLFNSAASLTFKNTANAGNADYFLRGGGTAIGGGPPPGIPYRFDRYAGGSITFENNSTAGTADFEIEGGSGNGGPNAQVTFRHTSTASAAEFVTKGGRLGPDLPLGSVIVGLGGQVMFEDSSKAGLATFHNEGQTEYFNGAGGFTVFTDTSTAENAEIHNHGATFATAGTNGVGGATFFYDFSNAGAANITNHADGLNHHSSVSARTVFEDDSNAGTATIENLGASSQSVRPGLTEFRTRASAAGATINNRGFRTVGDLAGRTFFYDDSTAANATLRTFDGYSDHGRIEFHDRSTAANADIFLENEPMNTASAGGYLIFRENSTAADSDITLRTGTCCGGGVQFYNNATAADADFIVENGAGQIAFFGNSSAGDPIGADTPAWASFTLGQGDIVSFYDQSTADDAHFSLADRAQVFFQNSSSAGTAQIAAAGGSVYTANIGATITFNQNSTADHATILVTGATAPLASPAAVWFINGSHAGHSTLIANGGTGGGAGATVTFTSGATGDTARLVANTGGTFDFAQQFAGGTTTVGSINGAGTFYLRGTELVVGTRDEDSTVTGQIVDTLVSPTYTGGRLTKIGTRTLTLAGANTYTGATTVDAGTLRLTGSIVGDVFVNAGARLEQAGTIGGDLNVAPGGVWAPGSSPGTATLGGLTMSTGSILDFEIGATRDHIVLTNNGDVALDGILNVSLLDGFTPTLGQTFPLFEGAIGSVTGAFDAVIAPIFNGLTLNVVQSASSVMLQAGPPTFLAGDFNGDLRVDGADLTNWKGGFGTASGATHSQGNADGDADADGGDFLVWQQQFGAGPSQVPASPAVPEPASAIALGLGMLVVVVASRRKAALGRAAALSLTLAAPAAADYAVQDNIAFNAKKINPYDGGPAWHFEDTIELLDERLAPGGPVTIGPLDADPLGLALEALLGVDLPHVVKLKTGASLSGHAKANFGYYVTAGRLDISYPASASLNFQTAPGTTNVVLANSPYTVDGGFMPGVSQRFVPSQFFQTSGGAGYATAPLRSQTDYQQPWFETQSPWASAWIEASADIQASIFTKVSALGGLKEWRKDIRAGGKVGGRLVEIDPTGLYVAGEEVVGFDLTQPIGPIPIGGGAADLTIRVPNIAVSSVTNAVASGNPSVISAYKEQPIVTLTGNLERLIPFVGTILQNQIGPLGYDLLNLAGGPQLNLYQEMTFTPDPKVRLTFSEPVLVGASNVPTNEALFDLDEAITWRPMFSNSNSIRVRPTYLLNNTFRNETGLNVDLVIDVEALSLTGDFPPFNGTLGPLYEKKLTFPIFPDGELFAPQFPIPLGSVTGGSVPGIGPITTGEIEFQKSNLALEIGLGDMQLLGSQFVSSDPINSDIETYDLQFTRTVEGGSPRLYSKRVTGLHGFVDPEGANVGEYLVSATDIIVTDDVTGQNYNLGKSFTLFGNDLSALLPATSPFYPDPNPSLGKLFVSTQPDDLSFVPDVDLNPANHPKLDQYNATDDLNPPQDSTLAETTEVIDRAAYPDTTILVRNGEVIPDGIGRFVSSGAIGLNEAGGVAHRSNLTLVPPGSSSSGFYYTDDAGKNKLYRAGEFVPGSSQTIVSLGGTSSGPNELGQVAVVTQMSGSFSNSVVLRAGPDGLKTIARNGQAAPDGNGTFQDFFGPALNNSGQVAFLSRVTYPGLGTKEVMYVSNGTALTEIARQGDAAPGMPGQMAGFGYFSFNDSSQVSFDVYTTGNVQGLYLRDGNQFHLIAVDGGAVPGGGNFVGINDHELNNSGQIAFIAGLREFPGGPLKFGIFRGEENSLVQIAREGQLAPDGDGTLESSFFTFNMNDAGQVVFRGRFDAPTDYEAILLGDGGNLTQIAREGMAAPDGIGYFDEFDSFPQVNNRGHVAFGAAINDEVDEARSIFVYDGVNFVQVARVGQPLAGSTVTGTSLVGINDNMQVAYTAGLANGSSVIARFEPSIYWSKPVSGNWGAAQNWSLGIEPRDPYDVHIIAENALTVAGPAANRTIKSLTLGAEDSALARLHLASNVTLTATNGATIRPNGLLTGHGTLAGSVTNEGVISPGASPGALAIHGDFTQSSVGSLVIEMASATNYDQLLVTGDITLGGTLAVALLDGFVPTEGQQFSIFGNQFDSVTGAFQSFQLPMFNGLTFAVSQNLTSITLNVVKAPADFDEDGDVDGQDFVRWKSGFGTSTGATHSQGDANADGDADGGDFLTWQQQFAGSGVQPAADFVAEPAALGIALLAAVSVFQARRAAF